MKNKRVVGVSIPGIQIGVEERLPKKGDWRWRGFGYVGIWEKEWGKFLEGKNCTSIQFSKKHCLFASWSEESFKEGLRNRVPRYFDDG